MKRTVLIFGVCLVGCGAGSTEPTFVVPEVVTRRDVEPAGEHCAHGGTAIQSGADRNVNGLLDDEEIQHTDYVCDPATAVLIRRDPLGPDAACPTGGTAVRTGIDGDGDGVLDDSEVQSITEVCGSAQIWEGDFTAADWADPARVAALQTVRVVTGTLTIDTADPVTLPTLELVIGGLDVRARTAPIDLPVLRGVDGGARVARAGDVAPSLARLERVGGDLLLDGSGSAGGPPAELDAAFFDAPTLHDVGGTVRITAAVQIGVSLPGVRTIGGDLMANADGNVARIALPDLEVVTGSVWIAWQSALTEVSLPASQTVGGNVTIWACPALTRIALGTAGVGGELAILNSPALATLSLPRLQTAPGGPHLVAGVEIDEVGLATLELPALRQVNRILVSDNAALTSMQLPALTDVTTLRFMDNPVLASVSVPELTTLEDLEFEQFDFGGPHALHALDFGNLTTVTGRILIIGATLPDLSAFRNLTRVQSLELAEVDQLADLRSLASLAQIDLLDLYGLPSLTSLDGLEWLTELPDRLSLQSDPALVSIGALRRLTRVGGWFQIGGDYALANLELPALTEIGGTMELVDMPAVTDLSGLSTLRSIGGDITFLLDALSDDQIAAFLRQVGRSLPAARDSNSPRR